MKMFERSSGTAENLGEYHHTAACWLPAAHSPRALEPKGFRVWRSFGADGGNSNSDASSEGVGREGWMTVKWPIAELVVRRLCGKAGRMRAGRCGRTCS